MNISQHAIIPLGYPVRDGYYNASGTFVTNSQYCNVDLSLSFGCNKFYRALPFRQYGNLRGFDTSEVDPVESLNVSLNQDDSVFNFSGDMDVFSVMTSKSSSLYYNYMDYPFLIFYKDDTPSVQSLSLGNPFSPDVIDDEEEMI